MGMMSCKEFVCPVLGSLVFSFIADYNFLRKPIDDTEIVRMIIAKQLVLKTLLF